MTKHKPAAEQTAAPATAQPAPQAEPQAAAAPGDDGRVLLEDWTPLAHCLAYRVGRLAWLRDAAALFADDTVPHLVHDNGTVSQRTAQLLFAWCQEQARLGSLPAEIAVCEVGMGTGLHLRYALDAFKARCQQHGVDWYDRLVVLATDVSAAVARQAVERGLFADHAGHVRLGFLDVEHPQRFIELDTGLQLDLRGRVHLLIAFYVLDLFPVDLFRRHHTADGLRWEALWVRTWLRDPQLLGAYTDASLADIEALAKAEPMAGLEPLVEAWSLLQQQLRAWPVDLSNHPDLAELQRLAEAQEQALGRDHPLLAEGTVVVHSAGALRVAQLLGTVIADNGMVLLRDVGLTTAEQAAKPRGHARYGHISAAAVNMLQLDQWFAEGRAPLAMRLIAPESDGGRGQAARLLLRQDLPETQAVFRAVFDGGDVEAASQLFEQALAAADPVAALELLRQAIAREPTDWTLHLEAARLALDRLGRADVARAIALRAVELNPQFSADLWCVLGDALHADAQADQAIRAYGNALAINPRHVRSLWSLAYVEAERGRHGLAFELLGQALRWDRQGQWRGEILQLLDACLRGQTLQVQAERQRLAEQDQL